MTRSFGWCYVRVDEQMELLSCGGAVKLLQEREVCVRRHESLHGERVLSSKYLGTLRLGVSERQI